MQKQQDYYDGTLQPLMEKAENGKIALFFMDASHFVMGCDFLGHIYGKTRRYVSTFSGRMRYNVLGALDYASKKMLTVTNDTYITALEVCALLEKIAREYAGQEIHIVLYRTPHDFAVVLGISPPPPGVGIYQNCKFYRLAV